MLHHGKEEHKVCVGGEDGGRERRRQPVMENPLCNKRKKKNLLKLYPNNY